MKNKKQLFLENEAATKALGARLANIIAAPCRLYFSGELGAGKTTLIRALLRALGVKGAIKSPTFALLEPYDILGANVYHFDLYRLSDPEELEYIGFRDYLHQDAILLVEWPEKGQAMLPEPDLLLTLSFDQAGRQVKLEAYTDLGAVMLQTIS